MKSILYTSALCFTLMGCGTSEDTNTQTPSNNTSSTIIATTKAHLGEQLFHDTSLSQNRTMSCVTCHNPEQAFIDTRPNAAGAAVSLGDDGSSFGDRNTPMVSYSSFTPNFNAGNLTGGQFLDGRASTLAEQAKGPFLNPVEMNMPDASAVVARIQENENYISSIESLYGENVFDDANTAFDAIADAIASFEGTNTFFPFDANVDTNSLSASAQRGQNLFRSRRINCVRCHDDRGNALFTNFTYENLGVPLNTRVRGLNGHAIDLGLSQNPQVNDRQQDGKFKVSGLRNVAVTAPYMHNGVFQNLKTVVHFYNTRDEAGAINPETGQAWAGAEVNRNIVNNGIGDLGLSSSEEDDIVAFLEALTDAKYEHLIP